ncbi:MAG: UDP-3-O-(3-hydroxymyristoyl)glucosamine N-acyltransferase [Kiritimatiellia bacterium]|nr:UDP-3-O-(3-hydroxymyristoyl)glucosamine N-acyltransferase [Kiritimatiellia bacterium]MDP6629721.1 UDP-3-O-(3-hydroxymyristoyl)glucosamine N-acyltransferase [Kiritimatiellia bacterium]
MKTVSEIAELVDGVVEGDASATITGLAGLREARPGDLSLLMSHKYAAALADTKAAAVLVRADWQGQSSCALIRVANPDAAMTQIALALAPDYPATEPGVHPTAVVADSVVLGEGVCVGPLCVLEEGVEVGKGAVLVASCFLGAGARVGEDSVLHAHVSVREGCRLGARVLVHDGAVIGGDGFGFEHQDDGRWAKIPQVGIVEIGDDVEIGANTTVDRARFGRTVIANGVKIDNLVQIGHNVHVGENTAMAAQVAIAGSTMLGRGVQMGGRSGAIGHVTIGDNAIVGGNSAVAKDVEPGAMMVGFMARPHMKWKRIRAAEERLPELLHRVKKLEQLIEELKQNSGD